MEKYKIFLGSVNSKTYDEAKNFTFEAVKVYAERLNISLNAINTYIGHVFSVISSLRDYHSALASKALLENNLTGFKQNAYVAGFLTILSKDYSQWAYQGYNTDHFALILLSDNQQLIDYLVTHRDEIVDISVPYRRNDTRAFFNANTLLALSGDWALLK